LNVPPFPVNLGIFRELRNGARTPKNVISGRIRRIPGNPSGNLSTVADTATFLCAGIGSGHPACRPALAIRSGATQQTMARSVTPTDRAIIRLLQQNARISYAELSRATDIPESTVRRRMERLQQRGIIQFAMLAEPDKLGYEIRAMIGLRVELQKLTEIASWLRELDEVTFAAFLTGSFDVMIQVVVQSQDALVRFLTEKVAPIEGIRSSETFLMPWVIKPITSWVLPEYEEAVEMDDDSDDDPVLESSAVPIRKKRGRPRKLTLVR
jgi:Lrp/AsnC family transcriptional regulator for asnA, asnC and gidA